MFALLVWTLDAAVFPHHDPGLADGAYLALAVAAALLAHSTPAARPSSPRTVQSTTTR